MKGLVPDAIFAGALTTAVLERWAVATYNVPWGAVTAAMTGALVPLLLMDKEPLGRAVRLWAGSVAFALIGTSTIIAFAESARPFVAPVAGAVAMFARDLFAAIQGQVPPLVASARERLTGIFGPKGDKS